MLVRLLALCAIASSFQSCNFKPPPVEEVMSADIGEPPDLETAKHAAQWVIAPVLRDPTSAILEYKTGIRRGYVEMVDGQTRIVWALPVHITDRTKMGAYGNARIFEFYFVGDTMIGWSLGGRPLRESSDGSQEFIEPMQLATFRDGGIPSERPMPRLIQREDD